jgi:hypothetical protein
MSADPVVPQPGRTEYPQHARSLERHAWWARDCAVAGDFASAMDALWDVHALAMELTDADSPEADWDSDEAA